MEVRGMPYHSSNPGSFVADHRRSQQRVLHRARSVTWVVLPGTASGDRGFHRPPMGGAVLFANHRQSLQGVFRGHLLCGVWGPASPSTFSRPARLTHVTELARNVYRDTPAEGFNHFA